jgi:spermidine synthase
MLTRTLIDTADIPGGGSLRLMQRGQEYSIMLGSNELMNSRVKGSEEALATLAAERMPGGKSPRILIGGLGMGFTLRAALSLVGPGAVIVVAEVVPAVIEWARGPLAELFAGSLDDPRVEVRLTDVGSLIAQAGGQYDAILLDVDNGPDGLTLNSNDRLYNRSGVRTALAALQPGGVLAVWSSGPHPAFSKRLRDAGFEVNEVAVRATTKRSGARHLIWFATKKV